MSKRFRILVADDEPLARQRVKNSLNGRPEVHSIVEAKNGDEAFDIILEHKPEIVFLDIQMPGGSGFDVLERLRGTPARIPEIVFVTAYDEYALKAFEYHAVDYLLKPYESTRFDQCFHRVVDRLNGNISNGGIETGIEALLRSFATNRNPRFVSLRKGDSINLLPIDDIAWIEAQGNYIALNIKGKEHLLRETMETVAGRLDPERFIRVHRSTIVNIQFVREIEVWGRGEHKVVMNSGRSFNVSRNYRHQLDEFFRRNVL